MLTFDMCRSIPSRLVAAVVGVFLLSLSVQTSASNWDAEQICRLPSQQTKLLDKDRNIVAVVSTEQIRSIVQVKNQLATIAGINPTLLIIDGNMPNAFASNASGTNVIGFNIGMLQLIGSDMSIAAAVMGHEMGHLVKGHLQEKKDRDAAIGAASFLLGLALDYKITKRTGTQSNVGQNTAALGSTLVSYKFDRDQEREADALGVNWMYAAGFDPNGATRLWQRLTSGAISFLSDHPSSSERLENIQQQIAAFTPRQQPYIATNPPPQVPAVAQATSSTPTTLSEFRESTSQSDDPVVLGLAAFRERRFTDAFNLAVQAAGNADPRGQLGLGFLYFSGLGTAKDYSKAAEYFKLAAAQDSASANTYLGIIYENGYGVGKDFAEAATYYGKASDAGFPPGMGRLAELKLFGAGTPKDAVGAVALAQRAIVTNDVMANFVLGSAYLDGVGITQDFILAKKYLNAASQLGSTSADNKLGEMYALGRGASQDYPEAVRLFKKAALKGNPSAKTNLGFLYLRGLGVQRDYEEAKRLFEEAFRSGQVIAPYGLGLIFRDGLGVTADQARALAYFDYSSKKGYPTATRLHGELANKLSGSDLERSKKIYQEIAALAGI